MKKFLSGIAMLSFLMISCQETPKAEEEKPAAPEVAKEEVKMPDSATMMKNWESYMTPGPMHKMMASWDGAWEGQSTMWESPDKPPQVSSLVTVNKMMLGGRYQQSTNTGNMMGMPFEGMGTTCYDNAKKVFRSTWIDNFGTGIMFMEGPWDEATKSVTFTGKMVDPGMGSGDEIPFREVFKVVDDDHQEMTMYNTYPGMGEVKMMEIKWTRKK